MSEDCDTPILEQVRTRFRQIVEQQHLLDLRVSVLARALTPKEAIGTPGRRDFPIVLGREQVVEARVFGARGHAFTDSRREFVGCLEDVLNLELATNQDRAIFAATLNAVLRHLGMVGATVHCRDDDPERCAQEIAKSIFEEHGEVKVGLIGLNPAIAERLIDRFGGAHVYISDLNADNVGTYPFGVEVWDGHERTEDLIDASDVILVTGTTIVNGTLGGILGQVRYQRKPHLLYGVTAAGVSALMGIQRTCPCGRDG
jgi:uncharacterized protein (DUF4213/DUF364 family)